MSRVKMPLTLAEIPVEDANILLGNYEVTERMQRSFEAFQRESAIKALLGFDTFITVDNVIKYSDCNFIKTLGDFDYMQFKKSCERVISLFLEEYSSIGMSDHEVISGMCDHMLGGALAMSMWPEFCYSTPLKLPETILNMLYELFDILELDNTYLGKARGENGVSLSTYLAEQTCADFPNELALSIGEIANDIISLMQMVVVTRLNSNRTFNEEYWKHMRDGEICAEDVDVYSTLIRHTEQFGFEIANYMVFDYYKDTIFKDSAFLGRWRRETDYLGYIVNNFCKLRGYSVFEEYPNIRYMEYKEAIHSTCKDLNYLIKTDEDNLYVLSYSIWYNSLGLCRLVKDDKNPLEVIKIIKLPYEVLVAEVAVRQGLITAETYEARLYDIGIIDSDIDISGKYTDREFKIVEPSKFSSYINFNTNKIAGIKLPFRLVQLEKVAINLIERQESTVLDHTEHIKMMIKTSESWVRSSDILDKNVVKYGINCITSLVTYKNLDIALSDEYRYRYGRYRIDREKAWYKSDIQTFHRHRNRLMYSRECLPNGYYRFKGIPRRKKVKALTRYVNELKVKVLLNRILHKKI